MHRDFPRLQPALLVLALPLVLAGCAGKELAREHRYVLAVPSGPGLPAPAGAPVLRVGPVRGEGLARGTLLWTRISPIEVEPWRAHQWALPAPELVAEALVCWARGSGRFREAASSELIGPGPVWLLSGTLEALEQEEGPEGWAGLIRLRLTLEEVGPGARSVLWQGLLEERAPAETRHPAAVVRALGRALAVGLDRAASEWPLPLAGSADSLETRGKTSAPVAVQGPFPALARPGLEGNQ